MSDVKRVVDCNEEKWEWRENVSSFDDKNQRKDKDSLSCHTGDKLSQAFRSGDKMLTEVRNPIGVASIL